MNVNNLFLQICYRTIIRFVKRIYSFFLSSARSDHNWYNVEALHMANILKFQYKFNEMGIFNAN